jgi:tRNA 5-methylaminomethyl-2-thiouridine biosynthesis bifunctional protein
MKRSPLGGLFCFCMTRNAFDPKAYFSEDGNPRSERFGDIYYSLQDGLNESRAVFLDGCGLPEAFDDRRYFTVAELGFGTGLNICALLQMWAKHRTPDAYLRIYSIEGFLMPVESARKALSAWPELSEFAGAILSQWPGQRRGQHIMEFPHLNASLTLSLNDVKPALENWDGLADAWFLDGFSPSVNGEMWTDEILNLIALKSKPKARLATFTVAGVVRRGLTEFGFTVEKKPGFGKKRERLEAVKLGGPLAERAAPRRFGVIGAGIAGASVVYALRQLGHEAIVFDPKGLGGGASGNRAGLLTPRIDAGAGPISELFADGFYYARALYQSLCPEAILSEGVFQKPVTERDLARYEKIAQQPLFISGDMTLTPEGLHMPSCLAIDPLRVIKGLMGDTLIILEKAIQISTDKGLSLKTETHEHKDFDHIFITCGAGIFNLGDIAEPYGLKPVRGQIETVIASERPTGAQAWGGYYAPTPEGFVFGSTHTREDYGDEPRLSDQDYNIETLKRGMPEIDIDPRRNMMTSRAGVRVMTRDYLPLMGEIEAGVLAISGLGARGYCLGPLLGRALVAKACGLASPLPLTQARLLRPERLRGR